MRRKAAMITMLAIEVLVAALSAVFYLRARVAIADAFAAYGTPVPGAAAVAIAPWFLPVAHGVAAAMTAVAWLAPLKNSRRMAWLGGALVVCSFALVFAVAASFVAVFQPAG